MVVPTYSVSELVLVFGKKSTMLYVQHIHISGARSSCSCFCFRVSIFLGDGNRSRIALLVLATTAASTVPV